jgi:hypothetical protein
MGALNPSVKVALPVSFSGAGEGLSVNEYVRPAAKNTSLGREKPERHTVRRPVRASFSGADAGIRRPTKEKRLRMTVT